MSKELTIIDKDYIRWVEDLSVRYRQSQIRAAVRVNRELLKYYWELGRDIEEMRVEERWGEKVIKNLSVDLQRRNPNATGLSRTNIYYAKKFYLLYSQYLKVVPQAVEKCYNLWQNPRSLSHKLWDNWKRCFSPYLGDITVT